MRFIVFRYLLLEFGPRAKIEEEIWNKFLEVEIVDIRLVEYGRLAEQDRAVLGDGVAAQLARGEAVAGVALDLAARYGVEGVDGEVAEVAGVPQLEGGTGPALDVGPHLVGRAQARDD